MQCSTSISGYLDTAWPTHHTTEFLQSPIITTFHSPEGEGYDFQGFYQRLKTAGFVIYPGKVSDHDTCRIGTIGAVGPHDIERLLVALRGAITW